MLRIGSLFSGAGLCDLGFHRAGFVHRFFCEVDPYCRRVLARHWPGVPIFEDVRDIDPAMLPEVDVLSGGFPCQDVSCGGRRAGITTNTRSGLWYEFKRIIASTKPRYIVIENVKGLLSKGMEIVLQDLADIGCAAEWQSIPAALFGAPHLRERIFIVAYPDSDGLEREPRILPAQDRILGEHFQLGRNVAWRGVHVDRACRQTSRQAYSGPAICRVDDGHTGGLDMSGGYEPRIPFISSEQCKQWSSRLTAIGNGITPQQAVFVACRILWVEGLPMPAEVF
jgi:DNA (cytosine-5)-methyltransferase 1